jgi:predicted dehydrogenase
MPTGEKKMRQVTRRDFVKGGVAAGLGFGLTRAVRAADTPSVSAASPNSDVRLAIIGLGGIDIPGSVGGRGRQLIDAFQKVPGAKIAAICDVDKTILENGADRFKKVGESPKTYDDLRRVLDDKDIDAVVVALPNHWHVLAAVWACQAGKHVYVEKPLSYNIWEGRQVVAAAKKYDRIVQVGTQGRSSPGLRDAFEFIRGGQIGKIRYAHILVYRLRDGIGKVTAPTPIPSAVDYNQWCGPAPMGPLMRKYLHYDWHWFWSNGGGEIGNNGIHYIDMCRWALGISKPPRRAISIGGRFAYNDDGQTPNTNVVFMDTEPAPIICEVRGLPEKKDAKAAGKFRNLDVGILIQCEGGYVTGSFPGGKVYDNQDKVIQEFKGPSFNDVEVLHTTNFIEAVRSGKAEQLHAPVIEGHLSAACFHMANVSYRLGAASAPQAIREATQSNKELAGAFERYREHLAANDVDLDATGSILGPWVTLDPGSERFVGGFADQANALAMRQYREPFVVPTVS